MISVEIRFLTLESPLKHCDSAQQATTGQPGATPQISSIPRRFALKGLHKTVSTHAQVKWHNRRIHNQGSDGRSRRRPGERNGVSPPSQMRATRWADTHRSPSEPGAAFIRIRGFSCPRLICASLSGSITACIKYNSLCGMGPTMHFISRRTFFVSVARSRFGLF